jgi:hypothetical protein
MEQKTDRLLLIDLQRAEIDLDYSDCLTLVISTSLIINFPRPRFAVLPISLGVTLSGLSGTVRDGHHSLSVQPASLTFFFFLIIGHDRAPFLSNICLFPNPPSVHPAFATP